MSFSPSRLLGLLCQKLLFFQPQFEPGLKALEFHISCATRLSNSVYLISCLRFEGLVRLCVSLSSWSRKPLLIPLPLLASHPPWLSSGTWPKTTQKRIPAGYSNLKNSVASVRHQITFPIVFLFSINTSEKILGLFLLRLKVDVLLPSMLCLCMTDTAGGKPEGSEAGTVFFF